MRRGEGDNTSARHDEPSRSDQKRATSRISPASHRGRKIGGAMLRWRFSSEIPYPIACIVRKLTQTHAALNPAAWMPRSLIETRLQSLTSGSASARGYDSLARLRL